MIFARYKGNGKEFTPGKVYLATPEMNDAEMVGFKFLMIDSDAGPAVRVTPEEDSFEYLEEIYAVAVRPVEDLDPGEVVVINDAVWDAKTNLLEPNGYLMKVKGVGLYRASNFVILDRTNIFPGLVIRDTDGSWRPVRRVDECLWVMVEGSTLYRSPEEFEFAVSGGDILTEPIVKCIDANGMPNLTAGKFYRLNRTREDGNVDVYDDQGVIREFMASRFQMEE